MDESLQRMKRLALTNFSIRHPWLILAAAGLVTVFFALQFPKVTFDNDPENMLSKDEFVRVFHHQIKKKYKLYDFVIVGIVNDKNPDGVFNVDTLSKIDLLSHQLLNLRRGPDGLPQVVSDAAETNWITVDLRPESTFKRLAAIAFRHDPNELFDKDGRSAVIGPELISPSVVDNIKQAELGSLKLEYLMEHVPRTRKEALAIREDAMNNPLYNGTLVSEDGRALCIYIPIIAKKYSYNVATLVRRLTRDWKGEERIFITGLPVAEDTFGVEMLVQMAISAPLALLILFLLMYAFFRRVALIVPPLLLAIIAVVWTMGLLIGLGFDVHIMSSMIPIFIMPITVCNSIHVLSEFFDSYHRFNDKAQTIRHVVRELYMPMLYATTTTIAGFASLATTPIPPVRVFGLHVAFGVAAGWLMTMTFVPAFITVFISDKSLHRLCAVPGDEEACEIRRSILERFLAWIGQVTYRRARLIVGVAILILGFSAYGISLIQVNDNPVKWFTKKHPLRIADRVLNKHFGGTYMAYLTLSPDLSYMHTCHDEAAILREKAQQRFAKVFPDATRRFLAGVDDLSKKLCNVETCDPRKCLAELAELAGKLDEEIGSSWNNIADTINYLDPDGLTYTSLVAAVRAVPEAKDKDKEMLFQELSKDHALVGEELMNRALEICDRYTSLSFRDFVLAMDTEMTAPAFKRPQVLRYVEKLQQFMASLDVVGKTSSAVDALKKAAYELKFRAPPENLSRAEKAAWEARNNANFAVPDSAAAVGQVFIQLEGMKKKDALFHMVTKDYREANIWVQLKSGDNRDMTKVVQAVDDYFTRNPPPIPMQPKWAGLTYLNVVWQKKMVTGMLSSLASSYVVVFIMMLVLFRSGLYGVLSMIPLSVTIAFIYGLIGWFGKDYDMPVAILSAMTLGLSVDFAIHFLERGREMYRRVGEWRTTNQRMFDEPAKAISRNAIVIAVGFLPLLLAPLVPYRTVGLFLALIMSASWLATLFILPALSQLLENKLFGKMKRGVPPDDNAEQQRSEQ